MIRPAVAAGLVVVLTAIAQPAHRGAAVAQSISAADAPGLAVPNRAGSLKFAAIGDNGTGDQPQYEVARQMEIWRRRFAFDMVIMLGDNIYGSQQPADFMLKFERPYKPLLDAGVKFYASLGNHDKTSNDAYAPFNMGGQRYYTYARQDVRFFVLDTNVLDPAQLAWLENALKNAREPWKIAYFHHPLYSDGGRHGSEVELRVRLEPIFVKYGVNVVYSGHDHVYERIKPQKGITYFVSGAGGQLRPGDLRRSDLTAAGFDKDRSFMLNEIAGDDLYFQAVSRVGETVDRGVIRREERQ
ncbi:MAG TPA: metallophosphoesterase [Vicinamibacterales bacterium]|nr:metallophosphoesterase [Vicinamibacterales bacterium]